MTNLKQPDYSHPWGRSSPPVRRDPPGQLNYSDLRRRPENGYGLRALAATGLISLVLLGLAFKDELYTLARYATSPAIEYKIERGDSIDFYGKNEGLSPNEVRAYRQFVANENGLVDPDKIPEGQTLKLRDINRDGKVGTQ